MSINGDVIAEPVYEENDYKDSWGSMKGLVYNEGLSVVIENGKIAVELMTYKESF